MTSKEGQMPGPKDTIQIKKREGVVQRKGGLHFVQCSESYASMVHKKCRRICHECFPAFCSNLQLSYHAFIFPSSGSHYWCWLFTLVCTAKILATPFA